MRSRRQSAVLQCRIDTEPEGLYLIAPPKEWVLGGGDESAGHCLGQIMNILSSFGLSHQLGLPTPARNLTPALAPPIPVASVTLNDEFTFGT